VQPDRATATPVDEHLDHDDDHDTDGAAELPVRAG
jgi:hypothetical protein